MSSPPTGQDVPSINIHQSSSAADEFAKLLQMQDHRGKEARRRDSTAKHPSLDGSLSARTSFLPSARGSGLPLHRRSSSRPEPLLSHNMAAGGDDGIGGGGEPLFVDEKEWSNVMNNTLALLVFVFVIAVMYCCYTLIAPYQHGIGWGILLSVVFHKSGESLFTHGRARKSRREECLATMVRRRKEMKTVLAGLLSSRRGGEHKPIRGCPAVCDRVESVGDATFRHTEDVEMDRVQGFRFILSYISWVFISLLSRVISIGVFLEYLLLEVGDTLGLKKLHYIPDSEKQYTAYHRIILCALTYMVVGGTILAVGGPIGYLIIHILAAASLIGFFLPYVTVSSYMPTALRLFRLVFIGGFTVLLGLSFYRDVGNVTETVSSGASYVLGDNGHMVGEFFTSIESKLLEDVARSFNASNVTKTAHDIRHALKPLLVQWSGSEDGEVRILNWTEQINVIMSSFYSTTEIMEDAHLSKREKRRRMRKAGQIRGVAAQSGVVVGVSSDEDEEWDNDIGKPPVKPSSTTSQQIAIATTTNASPPSSPQKKASPGMLSTAQTLLGTLGTKLRPVPGVVLTLFKELFSNILRLFDSIYELVLLTCVYRFCQAQQDSILYYTIRKALSTVDPWTAPARARTLEEDIILQFLTLLQSFWHISWYHFSVTYICLELCAIPLPFLLGVTAVLMALFPLLTRFVSPVFVALYTILFNEIVLSGNVSFPMGSIVLGIAILCMFVQSGYRYILMAVLYVMGFISIEDANHYDVFRWIVLLLGVAVLQNDEWLLTVRHSSHTRGARKSGGGAGPSSPLGGNKRGRGGNAAALASSSKTENSSSISSIERFQQTQSGELPTFIVGTCVVLGLVTYGLPGVIVGPLLFIVAKATFDNIGWDIPADIIAATDAALRGGDPKALYEAVAMYTGETLSDPNINTDDNPPINDSSLPSIKLNDDTKAAASNINRPSATNMLLQSHTGSSTFLRTAVWRALAQQRAGRMAGGVGSSNPFKAPPSGMTTSRLGSAGDVKSLFTVDPHGAGSATPIELDRSLDGTSPINTTPASRSSSSDIGAHMSDRGKSSLTKRKA